VGTRRHLKSQRNCLNLISWLYMGSKERPASREDFSGLAEALGQRFIQRWDVYGQQLDDGSYVSIRRPLGLDHLMVHLRGQITLGAYLLDNESKGSFLVMDADNAPDWRRLQALAVVLNEEDAAGYLEKSRRGGHLWLFFDAPLAGKEIRHFGQGLLRHFSIDNVELFPKQDKLTTGPGSLIRLPFGVHRKSGRRYGFYKADGRPLAPTLRDQIHALRAPETVSKPFLKRFPALSPDSSSGRPSESSGSPSRGPDNLAAETPLPERIKDAIPMRQFILRHVELSNRGKGLCPFHDDTVASFSVNDEDNYWKCFGCEKGGSVIDFWMGWRKCDFATAVDELAEMLL